MLPGAGVRGGRAKRDLSRKRSNSAPPPAKRGRSEGQSAAPPPSCVRCLQSPSATLLWYDHDEDGNPRGPLCLPDGNLHDKTAGDLSPQAWAQKLVADTIYKCSVNAAEKYMGIAGTLHQTKDQVKPFREEEVAETLEPSITIDRKFEAVTLEELQSASGRRAKKKWDAPMVSFHQEGLAEPQVYFCFRLPTDRHPLRTMTIATKMSMGKVSVIMARIDHVMEERGEEIMKAESQALAEKIIPESQKLLLLHKNLKSFEELMEKHGGVEEEGEEDDGTGPAKRKTTSAATRQLAPKQGVAPGSSVLC